MKQALVALLLAGFFFFNHQARAQKPDSDFRDTLSKSTLAIYAGKQVCKYVPIETLFGPIPTWQCGFESHFTCTATVVSSDEDGQYVGLTAGHCFDYEVMDQGYKYYVSEGVNVTPVLRTIELKKFENNDQYDYAIFYFKSLRDYTVIHVEESEDRSIVPPLGTRVLNVNFSFGVVKEVTEGVVVSKQIGEQESKDYPNFRRRFMIQMPFGPGASGSAIVDEDTHKIVGLVEAMFPKTQMAAVVIPTGRNFLDFLEDDSIGLKPEPEPKKSPDVNDTSLMSFVRMVVKYFFPFKN